MTTEERTAFLQWAYEAALQSGHIFPGAAAAECAIESAWGTSELAKANNLFGLKKPQVWNGDVISLPTREFIDGKWITTSATWPVFASWADCMTERMNTLHLVSRYAHALQAQTPEEFIALVSKEWSTDPQRGENVLKTYHAHLDILSPTSQEQHGTSDLAA